MRLFHSGAAAQTNSRIAGLLAVTPTLALLPFIVLGFVLLLVRILKLLGLSDRDRRNRGVIKSVTVTAGAHAGPVVVPEEVTVG